MGALVALELPQPGGKAPAALGAGRVKGRGAGLVGYEFPQRTEGVASGAAALRAFAAHALPDLAEVFKGCSCVLVHVCNTSTCVPATYYAVLEKVCRM